MANHPHTPIRTGYAGAFILLLLVGVVIILVMYTMPTGGGGGKGAAGGGGGSGTSYLDTISRTQDMGEESHVLQTAEAITTDLVTYNLEHNKYPTTIEELSEFTNSDYRDPWDDPLRLVIQKTAGRTTFIISSRGNDGEWDTEDDIVVEKPAPL